MYYPQQSPGMSQKLPAHHESNPWNRHLGVGVNPQPQPPTSPGYTMYTNELHRTLPSPPSHQQQSPAAQPISTHWQQQMIKYEEAIRTARSPHHRASAITITNPNKPSEDDNPPSPSLALAMAINHPSSTVGPSTESVMRPAAARPPENTWTQLDMGGVNIKSIPPTSGLFSFAFLTFATLELLDLSGNNLTSVPVEIGLMISLKELYFFDNHLTTIPPEYGTLHRLKTLGIEGNPMDAQLKALLQKDGTPALISFLRDTCPMPMPPPPRPNIQINPGELGVETFKVLCYNILCERAATAKMYGYTPTWALVWDYRKARVLQEVTDSKADIVCLQEVDMGQYEDFFSRHLAELGYEGVYGAKSRYKTMQDSDRRQVDGCATFFKKDRYQLVENHLIEFNSIAMQRQDFKKTDDMFNRVLGKDHIAVVVLLEDLVTGTRIIVSNTHLHWDAAYSDVKLVQTALLLEEVEKVAHGFAKYPPRPPDTPSATDEDPTPPRPPPPIYADGTKIPLIVCGDYNSMPSSGVYDFLSTGSLPPTHPDFLSHTYGNYTSEGLRHKLGLKSAYTTVGAGGVAEEIMPMTNFTPGFRGVLDYVWYSTGNLILNTVVGEIDKMYLDKVVGFPNVHFPSDHIALTATFSVKPPRELSTPRPPPVFS
ncbi:Endonuclease/exonuclease/phosphatase [Mycena haematopus]|nr:Endonuclease/exonuclease/phosphatase [Mycena haematopus]